MKKINFPKDFFFGGAVSAEQTEGKGITKKAESIFDRHHSERPKDFYNNVGPDLAIDTTKKYKEDVALLKSLDINSHRTSISWGRIFPTSNYEKPDPEAVQYYHDYIDEFRKNGIELFLTIYHFDMPQRELDLGGFESREVWQNFDKYASFIFKEFGGKVKYWTTMNEPWVPVQSSYIHGIQAPFLKNEQRAVNAAYGIVMSHAKAVISFNRIVKQKHNTHQIGAIFDSKVVYPKDPNNPADVKAAEYMDYYQFTGLTDPFVNGVWRPEVVKWVNDMDIFPENHCKEDIEELAKIKLDFVGLNFYAPARAEAPVGKAKNVFEKYFKPYELPGRRENRFRGWEIYPEAVYDTLKVMYDRYGNKLKYMLTEFGMGVQNESLYRDKDGVINDNYRISFIKEHLQHLHRFMTDFDVEVIGAHVWATFDCWSWNNAYKNTYGLIEVDLATMERKPKQSGYFMQELINNNGFNDDYKKMEEFMDIKNIEVIESVKF